MANPDDHVALVTGAGRGLGAAIARGLAGAGLAVAVNDLPASPGGTAVVDGIRAAGGRAEFVGGDVTDEGDVASLVGEAQARLGLVDVLVVNATGPQPVVAVEDLTWQDHLDHLRFFVKSPTLLVQAVLPAMKAARSGRVIMIGSDLFERALPGWSAYAAAKGAQLGLTRTWARELGPFGITVNLVAPGWIPVERHADTPAEVRSEYEQEVALRRFGSPDDVAQLVTFLASDAAAYITGERIAVNGGHTLA